MKRFVTLLIVCVTLCCVVLVAKDSLSKRDTIANNTQYPVDTTTESYTNTITTTTEPVTTPNNSYQALNFEYQKAMWFAFMDYSSILMDNSEEQFTNYITQRFSNAKDLGINTVYVQVRSHADSYYNSTIYTKGKYYNTNYDPLKIMVDVAHQYGLSIHAWINPMRCMSTEGMESMSNDYLVKQWYNSNRGTLINEYNGYWYLNPYYDEVNTLICDGIAEILNGYQVDGINIDDYFYPTTDTEFDSEAFSQSGQSNLSQFRRDNVTTMISKMYSTIKSINNTVQFGISPQGNIYTDYEELYADVYTWTSNTGYCDYIAPQIYYGFNNSTCPFQSTVDEWVSLTKDSPVKLLIGICTYKIGTEDTWAGSGSNEWIENPNVASNEVLSCLNNSYIDGVALYSYASTFEPATEVSNLVDAERSAIQKALTETE